MSDAKQLRKLGLFDARVPRYTSYPTANHFTSDFGERDLRPWLGAVAPGSEISLYIHIPFCRRLCWFCACRTQGTSTGEPVAAYLETVAAEIEMVRAALPDGIRLARLHWGGGTPTILEPGQMRNLARAVTSAFPLSDRAEFSIEIDPTEIDVARIDALADIGVNRASIGVQDFDQTIQATIGRQQPFDVTLAAAEGLRAAGIGNLNIDIVYGLPHQTTVGLADTVQRVLALTPDRVALYGYAHVPWMARRQSLIPTDVLPSPEERLALFQTAADLFAWDGYEAIGIDHFSRPDDGLAIAARAGTLRRNFQGYTDDPADVLMGLGASAISQFPQGFAQNAPATSDWAKRIQSGTLATARGLATTPDDRLRGAMIERLMCDFAIDFADVASRQNVTQADVAKVAAGIPERFPGIVRMTAECLEILPEGRPMTRLIARELDTWDVNSSGHSLAF